MKKVWFIYLVRNIFNDKVYVGYTENFEVRWLWHLHSAFKATESWRFSRALRKYGPEAFSYEFLGIVNSVKEAKHLENLWVITLRSYDPEYGYNMTYGGDGSCTEEVKKVISKKRIAWLEHNLEEWTKACQERWANIPSDSPLRKERSERTQKRMDVLTPEDLKQNQIRLTNGYLNWLEELTDEEWINYCNIRRDRLIAYWANLSEKEYNEKCIAQGKRVKESWDQKQPEEREAIRQKNKESNIQTAAKRPKEVQEAMNRKNSEGGKRRYRENPDTGKPVREFLVNSIWITNGVITTRVLENSSIPNGFRRGRIRFKKKEVLDAAA